jgi:hypothetical protein
VFRPIRCRLQTQQIEQAVEFPLLIQTALSFRYIYTPRPTRSPILINAALHRTPIQKNRTLYNTEQTACSSLPNSSRIDQRSQSGSAAYVHPPTGFGDLRSSLPHLELTTAPCYRVSYIQPSLSRCRLSFSHNLSTREGTGIDISLAATSWIPVRAPTQFNNN